ncbi:MAG: D-alanyl-D-alanine carboxypeptidase [Clostridiales bacterium]|nr:D-alanyl-D-alanine carboxypeptidase [Clostridiales bacterium]
MKRRRWGVLFYLWALWCALGAAAPCACAVGTEGVASGPEVQAKAALLMERETGTVLYALRETEELEPASVTKVMTMLLVAEAIDEGRIHLEDTVTVSAYAASMGGSQVYLEEGEQMTVDDLLKAVAVASGNDAAVALAEYVSGSEAAFVDAMNRRAGELGMAHTHFANCNGLPADGHYSCAYDIALMSRALLGHDLIRNYTSIWMDSLRDGAFGLANTNKLLRTYPGATGLKTGSTDAAGYCISASALQGDMELIAVVLGSDTSANRFDTATNLLNYGFAGWTLADAAPQEPIPAVPVKLGKADTVAVCPDGSLRILVEKGQENTVTTDYTLEESVTAPVEPGETLGQLTVYVDGEAVARLPLLACDGVERKGFGDIFGDLWRKMAMQS